MFIQNRYFRLSADILLYSNQYLKARSVLKKLKKWNGHEIMEYQFAQLKKLFKYSYQYVPYYYNLFKEIHFNPERFNHIEEIRSIPYLTRDIISKNIDIMISTAIPKKYQKVKRTGGTTGPPMELYLDRRTSSPTEFAYIQFIWKKVGFKFYDRCAVLRADIPKTIIEGKKYWTRDILNNWLIMSSHRLNKETSELYCREISRFKPRFIIGYPSVIHALSNYVKDLNIKFPSLKAIICSSETLYIWQRRFLTGVFGVPVYAYYGLTEKCCIAGECDQNSFYKFIPTYGYVELINNNDDWCSEEDETGEIVATGFNNYLMPFIRYKTQDMGIHTRYDDNSPGWKIIKEITGRKQEFFIDQTGSQISFTCSDDPFLHIINKINAYQYIQDTPGKVELRVDLKGMLTDAEVAELKSRFSYYYPKINLTLQIVDHIARTKSGKFRYLVQNINST